jgi:hypothetical protein
VVAIIDEEDDENGDAAHPSPSRISPAGNDKTLLYPNNVPPAPPMPRSTDPSPRHQEGEIAIKSHHELAQTRRRGNLVDAVA